MVETRTWLGHVPCSSPLAPKHIPNTSARTLVSANIGAVAPLDSGDWRGVTGNNPNGGGYHTSTSILRTQKNNNPTNMNVIKYTL